MASTEERITELAQEFLDDRAPDFDRAFADAEISSMTAVAFAKTVATEFGREIPAEAFSNFRNLRDLVAYLDG